ncbi:MAG: winged helix-turn-helix transcriptional regulator [Mameliella sp.]|nr:winged helix-turn-helix transcriptional regulator [Mameliella sp.]
MSTQNDDTTAASQFRDAFPVSFLIHQLEQKLSAQGRALIARHSDLTLPQWRIIRVVGLGVAEGSTALRKVLGFDKSQFSKTVNQLQARGLVSLSTHPRDGRQFCLSLTEAGRETLHRLAPVLDARNAFLMQALSEDERNVIRTMLLKLTRAAEVSELPDGLDT